MWAHVYFYPLAILGPEWSIVFAQVSNSAHHALAALEMLPDAWG